MTKDEVSDLKSHIQAVLMRNLALAAAQAAKEDADRKLENFLYNLTEKHT